MQFWEYQTRYIEIRVDEDGKPDNEHLERILNVQGALGWEMVNFEFCGDVREEEHYFWITFKRPKESCVSPYFNSGYSDEHLFNIYLMFTPVFKHDRPLTKEEVDFFLENAHEDFIENPKNSGYYTHPLRMNNDREAALKEFKHMIAWGKEQNK